MTALRSQLESEGLIREQSRTYWLADWFGAPHRWALAGISISVVLIAVEAIRRSHEAHQGLADDMLAAAAGQFLPAAFAGVLLTFVLLAFAPETLWMLPGLWAVTFSLGVFASCRFLPRQMFAVGAWYLAAGLVSLLVAAGHHALLPWAMGLPFGIGQLLVAAVLRFGFEDAIEET